MCFMKASLYGAYIRKQKTGNAAKVFQGFLIMGNFLCFGVFLSLRKAFSAQNLLLRIEMSGRMLKKMSTVVDGLCFFYLSEGL